MKSGGAHVSTNLTLNPGLLYTMHDRNREMEICYQPETIVHGESNQKMVGCVAKSRQRGPTHAPHVTEIFPPVEKSPTLEQ